MEEDRVNGEIDSIPDLPMPGVGKIDSGEKIQPKEEKKPAEEMEEDDLMNMMAM